MRTTLGLVLFVATFVGAGYALVLPLLRPRRRDAVVLLPFAYVAGLAAVATLTTLLVIAGVPLRGAIAGGVGGCVAAGLAVAVAGPRPRDASPAPQAQPPLERLVGAIALAGTVVVLEAAFRAARLAGLYGWDAGAFWVPKAEAVFFTGGLDERHFATIPGNSYPPLVPVVQATAFEFLGGADPARLHLVYWTFLAGAALGAGAVVSRRASHATAWLLVLLVLGSAEVTARALVPQGDFLMDVFLAFVLLLVVVFVQSRTWQPAALALAFAAAAGLTKREALLPLLAVAVATAVATSRRRRETWPWAAAVAASGVATLSAWRLWAATHDLPGPGPEAGGTGLLDHVDRLWPSIRLVASTLVDPEHWSILLVATVAAALVSAVARREEGVLVLVFLGLAALSFVWVMWALPSVPLTQNASVNPIVRLCGAALVPAALCVGLLVEPHLLAARVRLGRHVAPGVAAGVVATAALAYPVGVLAVDGLPRFPSRDDCSDRISEPIPPFEVVYVRVDAYREARRQHRRLVGAGFVGAQLLGDGCGRWKVVNLDVDTAEQWRGHRADARRVGYEPWLERA